MAVAARFEFPDNPADQARARRRRLLLETAGETAAGDAVPVIVHNVSVSGMLLETPLGLAPNESIEVDLPEAGVQQARIVWSDGAFHGCRFESPISEGTVSAIELRALAPAGDSSAPAPGLAAASAFEDEETFASRLLRLRKAKRLTLAAIAAELGVSKPTVWAWEQGRAKPTAGHMSALARTLGIDQADLAGTTGSAHLRAVIAQARQQIAEVMQIDISKVRILLEL
ncbi:transcriptional regulator with XRE-family HTH domain [Novosphingobium kunmingense]|uniref:Transcriptional regulator with XRE-family HTH domain n=1 Tax=Novosphingobium kunmingense TaxID=1211806 RepID=A0A2N0I1F1_9SPHN|nr:helix-turn-helix domain-containing protein [Novosphingobium kunmingense]PKB24981.1 transcriptional regulator with XRE-family HTH domain [Novosphingobium kunmingense]